MGILKNIWNTIFGKSEKKDKFSKGGDILNPEMKVVHKKENSNVIGGYSSGDTQRDNSKTCHYLHTSNQEVCNPPINLDNKCAKSTYSENDAKELLEPNPQVCNEVQERIDSQIKFEVSEPKAKRRYKERVKGMSMTKESEVLQYLLKYGSIDKRTCAEKFGLKRLDNVICELRKQGMNIKNETVELHNELGEKTKVNNYRLVTSDGAN